MLVLTWLQGGAGTVLTSCDSSGRDQTMNHKYFRDPGSGVLQRRSGLLRGRFLRTNKKYREKKHCISEIKRGHLTLGLYYLNLFQVFDIGGDLFHVVYIKRNK